MKYFVTTQVGVGVGYWYEKLDDHRLQHHRHQRSGRLHRGDRHPRIDWLGGLMTGYGNRPYEGGRFFVRMLYRF